MGVYLEKLTFNSRLDNVGVNMSYMVSAHEVPTAFLLECCNWQRRLSLHGCRRATHRAV